MVSRTHCNVTFKSTLLLLLYIMYPANWACLANDAAAWRAAVTEMRYQIKYFALMFALLFYVMFYHIWRQGNLQRGQAAICATIRAGVVALLLCQEEFHRTPWRIVHTSLTHEHLLRGDTSLCTHCVPVFLSLVSMYHWAMIISVLHSPVQDVWHYRNINSKRRFNSFPAQCPLSVDFSHSEAKSKK